MKVVIQLWLVLIITVDAFCQDRIQGTVLALDTEQVLPFTTVSVLGTNIGTISNAEGVFILKRKGLKNTDTLQFSYVGYETRQLPLASLEEQPLIKLEPAVINLQSVEIRDRELTAQEILDRVEETFSTNHPQRSQKQELFYHTFERTPWPKTNKFNVKKSDFDGLDNQLVDELMGMLPEEFVEYQDAVINLYNHEGEEKITPIAAISMEESSMEDLGEELEERIQFVIDDVEKSLSDEDIYYKVRSGVFATKIKNDNDEDSLMSAQMSDSLHYLIKSENVRRGIMSVLDNYTTIESDNWSFVTKPSRYVYEKPELSVYQKELVYKIAFRPERKGLFQGTIYVSTGSFAVIMLEFEFADGKQDETFSMLGIEHALNFKKGKVFFERVGDEYFPKYVHVEKREMVGIERNLSLMKKQKRFFIDKELNEIKMNLDLKFTNSQYWELLVINREDLSSEEFANTKEPRVIPFEKQFSYKEEFWADRTVIAPSAELKSYERKED